MKISNDNFYMTEKSEYDFYECPQCGYDHVINLDNFCCDCGVKLEWIINETQTTM